MTLTPGQQLSHYQIVAPLGAGAMGEVFRALDARLGREVAIKVLPEELAVDPTAVNRFEREGRAVAAISHPNVLSIFDVGTSDGVTYAVTELLEGDTLRARLDAGPLAGSEALAVAAEIAEGLAAVHAQGLVHRDLKPANVFLTSDGRVKIIDFGLARTWEASGVELSSLHADLTTAGAVVGTPTYMSPEQVRGEVVSGGSDVFSLGIVLHEMLSGTAPFKRGSLGDTLVAILHDEAPPLDQHVRCDQIVRRALAKKRDQRYSSAVEFAGALRAALGELGPAGPGQAGRRGAPGPARALLPLIALTVLAIAIVVLVLGDGLGVDAAPSGTPSLAVLPFTQGDHGAEMNYAGTAITLTLTTSLAQLRDLEVRPYSAVVGYDGQGSIEPAQIGAELGVDRVLAGRIDVLGKELLVSMELVDVERNALLWGTTVQRSSDELISLRDELVAALMAELQLELSREERSELVRRPTDDRKALEHYVMGRRQWARFDEPGARASIVLFEQALERDPDFALAHAGLADAYVVLAMGFDQPDATLPRVKEHADQALRLEPGLPEALSALATFQLYHDRDAAAAEQSILAALKGSPSFAEAYHHLAHVYEVTGRFDQALEAILAGHRLDPTSPVLSSEVGWVQYNGRRFEDAIESWERTLEDHPDFIMAAVDSIGAYVQLGRYDEALAAAERAAALAPGDDAVTLRKAFVLAHAGRSDEARTLLEQIEGREGEAFTNPSQKAGVYVALGDYDAAFTLLAEAIKVHDIYGTYIGIDPQFAPLRADPRFAPLLDQLGFEG